tara:strand:+ start:446 stop:1033 length:588 start_codon:yes stop_codon:yes gene_type:complete
MATSKVQIANLALVHVGGSAIISLTDDTNEARAVNQVYDLVRDAVLSDHPWNFAIKRVIPSVDAGTPVYDFAYRFDLPTDYLRLVGIEDNPDYKISGQFIECDSNPIKIKYVGENDTPTEYDAMFVMAFALRLASTIAERLTQSSVLSKELMEAYQFAIRDAKTVDAQSDQPDTLETNEWLDARIAGTTRGSGDL